MVKQKFSRNSACIDLIKMHLITDLALNEVTRKLSLPLDIHVSMLPFMLYHRGRAEGGSEGSTP